MDNIITGSILLGMGAANLGNFVGTTVYCNRHLVKAIDHQAEAIVRREDIISQQTAVITEQNDRINEMMGTKSSNQQPRFKTTPDEKVTQPNFKKGGKK